MHGVCQIKTEGSLKRKNRNRNKNSKHVFPGPTLSLSRIRGSRTEIEVISPHLTEYIRGN